MNVNVMHDSSVMVMNAVFKSQPANRLYMTTNATVDATVVATTIARYAHSLA